MYKMTEEFNLSEKRRKLLNSLLKLQKHSHMRKWLFALFSTIEEQDKEFIKEAEKKKICRYCGCNEKEKCHHRGTETLWVIKIEDLKKLAGEKLK